MDKITYSKAGVSIKEEEYAINGIKKLVEKTFRFREGKKGSIMTEIGSFANLIDMGDYALGMCIDGVGSKVLVAQELERYDTIGIDMVAMNVNDLICLGAEPIALVDYLATEKVHADVVKDIMHGIVEGAQQAEVALIGGELATLPDIIKGLDGEGFDLAGTAIGMVEKDKIITGEEISPGDVVLGFKSSGIHSNGLTLARKVLPKCMWVELLTPTKIYVNSVLEILEEFNVHGMVHVTGGGFKNFLRVTDYGFRLDNLPDVPMVFKSIKENSNISDEEMYRTFNMGVGFAMIVDKEDADDILLEHAQKDGLRKLGHVIDEHKVEIETSDQEIVLK